MARFTNDADMLGTSLFGYAKNVVREVVSVGRALAGANWCSSPHADTRRAVTGAVPSLVPLASVRVHSRWCWAAAAHPRAADCGGREHAQFWPVRSDPSPCRCGCSGAGLQQTLTDSPSGRDQWHEATGRMRWKTAHQHRRQAPMPAGDGVSTGARARWRPARPTRAPPDTDFGARRFDGSRRFAAEPRAPFQQHTTIERY